MRKSQRGCSTSIIFVIRIFVKVAALDTPRIVTFWATEEVIWRVVFEKIITEDDFLRQRRAGVKSGLRKIFLRIGFLVTQKFVWRTT